MPPLVFVVLLIAVLVAVVYVVVSAQSTQARRLDLARRRVKAATDLAYSHDDISPKLAGAIIDRTRGLRDDHSLHTLEKAIDDVLDLARQHREEEPDLSVIVIDELRRQAGPPQLG